ncbi:MAG: hypothetical protein RLZZ206_1385 [Cyanobacteriota bacterium]|jgi:hypothetical protein
MPNFDCVLLGAFERHNFGDLLMGHIFEVLLGRIGIRVVYASILENDLSSYGGAKVYSIFDLLDSGLDPATPILHVGGEVVPTSFHDALLADSPLPLDRHRVETAHRLRDLLATNRRFPYLTPPSEVVGSKRISWTNRIFYGTGYTKQANDKETADLIRTSFNHSLLAGFRDQQSLENATQLSIENPRITPDIVVYISKLLPRKVNPGSHYLLLHFSSYYLALHEKILVGQLEKISQGFHGSIKIALAGRLHGHDSVSAIHRLQALAAEKGVSLEFLPSENIFDICRQISGAQMVGSTSLHYRIVARSYGVPRISMNNPKITHWSRSNDRTYPFGVDPESLASEITSLIGKSFQPDPQQELDTQSIDEYIAELGKILINTRTSLKGQALTIRPSPPPAPSQELWFTALANSMHAKEKLLQQQQIQLSSRLFLLKRLLALSLRSFPKRRSTQQSHQ